MGNDRTVDCQWFVAEPRRQMRRWQYVTRVYPARYWIIRIAHTSSYQPSINIRYVRIDDNRLCDDDQLRDLVEVHVGALVVDDIIGNRDSSVRHIDNSRFTLMCRAIFAKGAFIN